MGQRHVLFGTRRGPHIVRPSRPHKFLFSFPNAQFRAVQWVQGVCCAAELSSEKGRRRFLYAETNLSEPGELFRNSTYEFAFDVKKPHESYTGTNVLLR